MKIAPFLFGFSLFVMCSAFISGTLDPSSRVVAGPLTLLSLACLIGSVIVMAREAHRSRQRSRQCDQQYCHDMRQGELQLAQAIAEEGLRGERRAKTLALVHLKQAQMRIEQAQLDSLRYKPGKRKR